jgi:hypothetical protein
MVRNLVACAVLAFAGTLISMPEPALAGARGGAMPAFRPAMMHARPHFFFRGAHRPVAPGAVGHHRASPSPRAYGTIKPTSPYGTVLASRPYATVGPAEPRFGHITLAHPRSHLTRRHHHAHHAGRRYPVTSWGSSDYIGTPYDPAEAIPVYGPSVYGPPVETVDPPPPGHQPARPRQAGARDDNADACRSERVTVPAAEGERQITVVRC